MRTKHFLWLLCCLPISTGYSGCRNRSNASSSPDARKAIVRKAVQSKDEKCTVSPQKLTPCLPGNAAKSPKKNNARLHGYRTTPIHARIQPNAALAKLIAPFRDKLREKMSNIAGSVAEPHNRKRPESMLGNLVAEMNLAYMRRKGYKVDVFLTNLRGIRRDMPAGVVTLGDLFEILPFENELVVMKLTGKQLLHILHGMAKRGGEPIAGARLWLDLKKKKAYRVRVRGRKMKLNGTYYLGTSRYLARTGWMAAYTTGIPLTLTPLMIRDGVIEGFKNRKLRYKGKLTRRIRVGAIR